MIKRAVCLLLIASLIFPLQGCWNYRGLNEMTIVAGIAIDRDPDDGAYRLSYEIVDLSGSVKEEGPSSKIIEAEGKTLFDATRNAKKRLTSKLYFGHTQIVVISEEIARSQEIGGMIDWFLRDGECRETMCVVISQEKTARDILGIEGLNQTIVSNEIQKIVEADRKITSSTLCVELYKIFDTLKAEGKSLVLPAMHAVMNDGKPANEANGLGVFKEQKLIGYLTPEEAKYYLFIAGQVKGGVMTFSSTGGEHDATLEISKNTTEKSFDFENGKVKFSIRTDTTVYLDELMEDSDALDEKRIAALENAAEAELKSNITHVIQKVQSEYGADIFGFGNMIYKKDFKLWNRIGDNWEEQFRSLEVEVRTDIHIVNTASVKKS